MHKDTPMKMRFFLGAVVLTLSGLAAHANASSIISDFDNAGVGLDGWTVIGDAVGGVPTYQAAGGNPGGFAQVTDNGQGSVIYWVAPSKFLGNQLGYLGGDLSFDMSQSPLSSLFLATLGDVQLISPGLTLVTEVFGNANLPTAAFGSETVSLSTSTDWRIGNRSGAAATLADLQAVLGNLTGLQIRGEISLSLDTNGLDNVVLAQPVQTQSVPEPASSALLLAGVSAAFLRRRRSRQSV